MKTILLALTSAAAMAASLGAAPMGTAFTYQGKLQDGGAPANGTYDFRMTLYSTLTGGTPVTATLPAVNPALVTGVAVSNGLFAVKLDFGVNVFQGDARWLNLEVKTNSNLSTFADLPPRQELTPTPYAIYAGTAGDAGTAGTATTAASVPWGGITGIPAGFADGIDNVTTYGPGFGLTLNSNTFSLDPAVTDARYWKLAGNAATVPGTDFIGTTDNNSLYIKVNNQRALWIRPTAGVPNLIGGSLYNGTAAGVEGAFIGGGGNVGADNSIYASFGALGGGAQNRIDGVYGFLGGGGVNRIFAAATYGVLGGGQANSLNGDHGVIGGGWSNNNQTPLGTIGGGANHLLQAPYSATIAGGYQNAVFGQDATIGGGSYNTAQADFSIVAGGQYNYVGTNLYYSVEFGWVTNFANASAILGGTYNHISSTYSGIGGGYANLLYGDYGHIGGGSGNQIGDPSIFSSSTIYTASTIGGGTGNLAKGDGVVVGGGVNNQALGTQSAVLGGGGNSAQGSYSAVLGGQYNQAGSNNVSGQFSLAAGRRAKALTTGSFVWGDSTDADIVATNANSMTFRATGGVRIYSYVDPTHTFADIGVRLAPNSGSWSSMSDRNAKQGFQAVDKRKILEKVAAIPITSWRYNGEDATIRHIGPTAQDFKEAFDLGDSDKSITTVDADGVALVAIQGLRDLIAEKDSELLALQQTVSELKQRLDSMQPSK